MLSRNHQPTVANYNTGFAGTFFTANASFFALLTICLSLAFAPLNIIAQTSGETNVTSRGVALPLQQSKDSMPKTRYAIILGISNYPYIAPLKFADKDAELFRDFLQSPAGGNVPSENINILLNENATAANFWVKGLSWLKDKNPQKGDRVYFYFAGHGDAISKDEYFFLPYECAPAGDRNNYLATGSIQLFNLKNRIAGLTGKGVEVILIMDACRTNELPGGSEGQRTLGEAIVERRTGEIIMLAASSGQESLESSSIGNGHGLFTWELVDGLTGRADADPENGNQDAEVDLLEIESWVKRNVRKIAQQKFNRVQLPVFCCSGLANISRVDSTFLKQWLYATSHLESETERDLIVINKPSSSRAPDSTAYVEDLIRLYNLFNNSVKSYRLLGPNSANAWYDSLKAKDPHHIFTQEAKYTLTTELINLAQEKINTYLYAGDVAAQGYNIKDDRLKKFLERQNIVNGLSFPKAAEMLEKGLNLSKDIDSSIANRYLAKLYFLKGRSVFSEREDLMEPRAGEQFDIGSALQYAYAALRLDPNAAYIYHLLAKLQYYKEWTNSESGQTWVLDKLPLDSVSYYEKQAVTLAPHWSYPYYFWGSFYLDPKLKFDNFDSSFTGANFVLNPRLDSAEMLIRKSIELNPNYVDAYYSLAKILIRKNEAQQALDNISKARALKPNDKRLLNDQVLYSFLVNVDTGFAAYIEFREKYGAAYFSNTLDKLCKYFIDKDNMKAAVFACSEQMSFPNPLSVTCYDAPAYALFKNNMPIYDSLIKVINESPHDEVRFQMALSIANAYDRKSEFAKAVEWYEKARQNQKFNYAGFMKPQLANLYYNLTLDYARLRKEDETVDNMETYLKNGHADYSAAQLNPSIPVFSFLRKNNRFKALVQEYYPDIKL